MYFEASELARAALPLPVLALAALVFLSLGLTDARAVAAPARDPVTLAALADSASAPFAISGDLAAVRRGDGIEVFARQGSSWLRQAVIPLPPGLAASVWFEALALSGDTLAVSAAGSV